jgi:xanthine/uracil permease
MLIICYIFMNLSQCLTSISSPFKDKEGKGNLGNTIGTIGGAILAATFITALTSPLWAGLLSTAALCSVFIAPVVVGAILVYCGSSLQKAQEKATDSKVHSL